MKILVITQYFFPENFRVNTLCKELVSRGHSVTVLTGYPQYPQGKIYDGYGFNKDYESDWNGVKINRIKMQPRGKTPIGLLLNCLSFVMYGNKWVKKCTEKFDAVYVFEVSPVTVGLPAVKYKEKFGTPIFFNVQDLWPENVEIILGITFKPVIGIINKIVDKIYLHSDRILCASNGFITNIASRGVNREKLVYWPQFCDDIQLCELNRPRLMKNGKFNIVFTGNIGKAQGLDLLVNTMSELNDENIHCFIVGDGRECVELKQLTDKLGVGNLITFVGRVSEAEANEYVHFSDCAYLSLLDNKVMDMTIPAKLQTYLACGAVIIGAVKGECADIIEKNRCGLVSPKNPSELAKKVLEMKGKSESELDEYRENSLKYSFENFRKSKVVDELENMFKELLE